MTSKKNCAAASVFVFVLALLSLASHAAEVTNQISCTAPTTRVNGAAFNAATELANYTLYASVCGGTTMTKAHDFGPECKTTFTATSNAATCTMTYTVTASDKLGLESAQSTKIVLTSTVAKPSPPSNVTGAQVQGAAVVLGVRTVSAQQGTGDEISTGELP